jgi:predicted AAA+ superfamily ATPase
MFSRVYNFPSQSVLLLGPRGVGKSTFIRNQTVPNLEIDLLKSTHYRDLSLNPSSLEDRVSHLKPKDIVFIDEIQRIPELLNEVHRLIESKGLYFYLTGSSARKLRKSGVNLLAGRAIGRRMFPLTLHELQNWKLDKLLKYGTLPSVFHKDTDPIEYLTSYVDMYLREEITQEAVTRNLGLFQQFLAIVGQYHGQVLNYENLAREVGKSGDTIKVWFEVLKDTLIGHEIKAFTPNLLKRETKHSKFYLFDPGVANALVNDLEDIPSERKGFLFESLILNELHVYLEVKRLKYQIFHFSHPNEGDIDFIIEVKKKTMSSPSQFISLDIKLSKKWNSSFGSTTHVLQEKAGSRLLKSFAIYTGETRLTTKTLQILPLKMFISELWAGRIF